MEFFSINAFLLGVLLFSCLYFSNIVYSLICILWKIKIVEFGIFGTAWFSLHNEKILGTKFILGWLPFSSHIKPLGMMANLEEQNEINPGDLPFAFFNKPKLLQAIFPFVPWIIYILSLFIAIFIVSNSNVISETQNIGSYVFYAFKTMFSDINEKKQFALKTKEIISGKNIVVFGFALLILTMLLSAPITAIMNWFANDEIKKSKIQKTIGFVGTILILWLILWKIPRFVFSFFTLSHGIICILSFFLGMFSVGIVSFFTTLFVVKNISQNLNQNNLKKNDK